MTKETEKKESSEDKNPKDEYWKNLFEGISNVMPYVAGVYWRLYNELQEKGFSSEQAIKIVSSYKVER